MGMRYLAAVTCPRCPSDSADWVPVTAMVANEHTNDVSVMTVGAMFRCHVCSLRWIAIRHEPDYIPDNDYWTGDEFE